jgi:hypothetical protein
VPTLTITLTADQKASLDAWRPNLVAFGTATPRFATTAELCAQLFSELVLSQALQMYPGTGTATETAISNEAAATAAKVSALRPTLPGSIT